MTRKDYILIANAFAEQIRITNLLVPPSTERDRVVQVATAVATLLGRANPRFNRRKFLEACGVVRDEQGVTLSAMVGVRHHD